MQTTASPVSRTPAGHVRIGGWTAALQAVLRIGPLVVEAVGGQGLPSPGSFNDPQHALAILRTSPDVPIVAALICATGVTEVVVVLALADRIRHSAPQAARLATIFGLIAASFLMIDGALGITALPQLAHLTGEPTMTGGAYLAILGVRNGIDRVIPLTVGLWALFAHVPAWRDRLLPRPIAALGLLVGLAGVAGAALPAAAAADLVLAIAWTAAFAVLLLRSRTSAADATT